MAWSSITRRNSRSGWARDLAQERDELLAAVARSARGDHVTIFDGANDVVVPWRVVGRAMLDQVRPHQQDGAVRFGAWAWDSSTHSMIAL